MTAAKPGAAEGVNPLRWWVVALLSLGMVIGYIDRVNLSAVLGEIGKDLQLDKEQLGMSQSAFFWTYTLFQIPAGMLVDRYGARVLYLYGFLLWSLASAGMTMMTGLSSLIFFRMLVGTGESVVTSSSLYYIRAHFEERQRGSAVGLYMTGTKVGPAIGVPIAGFLAMQFGWRPMFLILGAGALLWLIPWLRWVKKDDPAAQPVALAGKNASKGVTLGQALSNPVMWGIIGGTYCYMYFVYYCMTWMPTYFRERHGMSMAQMGWFTFVSFGGMAAVAYFAGLAADKLIARGYDPINVRKYFTVAGFLCASIQTLSVFTTSQPLMIAFTVLSLCGLGLATANYWALTTTLMPGALPPAIQNTAANLAGSVAPWLTGYLIKETGSFDAPIKVVGVWLALGVFCYAVVVRRRGPVLAS